MKSLSTICVAQFFSLDGGIYENQRYVYQSFLLLTGFVAIVAPMAAAGLKGPPSLKA